MDERSLRAKRQMCRESKIKPAREIDRRGTTRGSFGTRKRRSPDRLGKPRLLASPTVIAALLFLLYICTAASKGLPRSAGASGSLPRNHAQDEKASSSSSSSSRGKRDRIPTSARPVPTARRSDDGGKGKRRPTSTTKRGASSSADASKGGARTQVAAASAWRRRPGQQQQQQQQQHPVVAGGDSQDNDSGLDFDSDSLDYGHADDVWSKEGGNDDQGWSDENDDEEDDWPSAAAGGSGGGGGEGRGSGSGRRDQRWKYNEPMKAGGMGIGSAMSMSSMRDRLNHARQRASRVYREAKSLMSSEMEGVVLKATRPDDLPVKPKHLEALMRPTAEMPKEFNVYLPVVRKLWSKMADREWRVSAKAVYIVHRFAADGSIEHASNLKESVAVLRTHHDSRRKVNYFDMDTICDVKAPSWSGEDVAPMAEFLRVYAHFVLLRTTQFGPAFGELLNAFTMLAGEGEMIAAVGELVSAGSKCCHLRKEQEGAIVVAAALQVAQDVRDMVEVCAAQLDYLVREWEARSVYPAEVDRWYAFLKDNSEPVEALISRANELAERHKLVALRPLAATPLVLKLRDEEAALEKRAALEAKQQHCTVDEDDEELGQLSTADQRRIAALQGAKRHAGGFDGSSESTIGTGDRVAVSRPHQDARAREEFVPPSAPAASASASPSPAAAAAAPASAPVVARTNHEAAKDGAGTRSKRSISSGAGRTAPRPTVRRPPGGGSRTVAAAAEAEAAMELGRDEGGGGVKKTSLEDAGGKCDVDGGVVNQVKKKKRSSSSSSSSSSSISTKTRGGEAGSPLVKGYARHDAAEGTAAASSGSSRSSRQHASAPKRMRKNKSSSLDSPPRSG